MSVSLRVGVASLGLWLLAVVPLQANESAVAAGAGPGAGVPVHASPGSVPGGILEGAAESTEPTRASDQAADAPLRAGVLRAWMLPARSLEERVDRTLRAGYQLGMRNLEAPARAVLAQPGMGEPLERAQAAARLAPELPAARAALARALWSTGSWWAALVELGAAMAAVPAHLEASLWARALLMDVLFAAVCGSVLLFLILVAITSLPRWVRQLAVIREGLPSASRFALIASFLLLPAAIGEGVAGVVAALVFVAAAHGTFWRRGIVLVAALAFGFALYPALDRASSARVALGSDPVAMAAHAAEHGFPSAAELARIEWSGDDDPFAARALALRAKRLGRFDEAARRYAGLVEGDSEAAPVTAELLNNAASVALGLGEVDEAIAYYERAVRRANSPLVLFNLSQAYGRAIRLDAQDLALAEAQAIDAEEVALLTGDFGGTAMGLVADIPLPAREVSDRLAQTSDAGLLADRTRARIAPGFIGGGLRNALLVFGAALLLGAAIGLWLSRRVGDEDDHYSDIARVLQARGGDPAARMARIAQIRQQQARLARLEEYASFLIPGAAGVLGGRPMLGWISASVAALAVSVFWYVSGSAAFDPLAVGGLPGTALPVALVLLGVAYLALLGITLAVRETPR